MVNWLEELMESKLASRFPAQVNERGNHPQSAQSSQKQKRPPSVTKSMSECPSSDEVQGLEENIPYKMKTL